MIFNRTKCLASARPISRQSFYRMSFVIPVTWCSLMGEWEIGERDRYGERGWKSFKLGRSAQWSGTRRFFLSVCCFLRDGGIPPSLLSTDKSRLSNQKGAIVRFGREKKQNKNNNKQMRSPSAKEPGVRLFSISRPIWWSKKIKDIKRKTRIEEFSSSSFLVFEGLKK